VEGCSLDNVLSSMSRLFAPPPDTSSILWQLSEEGADGFGLKSARLFDFDVPSEFMKESSWGFGGLKDGKCWSAEMSDRFLGKCEFQSMRARATDIGRLIE
jgi:hypothetical protein